MIPRSGILAIKLIMNIKEPKMHINKIVANKRLPFCNVNTPFFQCWHNRYIAGSENLNNLNKLIYVI